VTGRRDHDQDEEELEYLPLLELELSQSPVVEAKLG
jgi:hypothetical protein